MRTQVVDRDMIQRGGGAGLLLEAAEAIGVGAELARQDLDGYIPAQPRVARTVDFAHPAGPERVHDRIPPEPSAGQQGHGQLWPMGAIVVATHAARRRKGPVGAGSSIDASGADRLGRNLKHLITLLDELQALGMAFVSLGEGIDATTPQAS